MRLMKSIAVFILSFSLILPSQAYSYWIWSPTEGKFVKPAATANSAPQKAADELYEYALKLRESGKNDDDAVKELKRLIREYPSSSYAPEAQFLLATILEARNKPVQAAAEYEKLIKDFPRSEQIEEATEKLFNLGKFFLTGEKQKVMGISIIPVLPKAVEVFQFIIEQAPYGPFGDQAQLNLAVAYRKMGRFDEAITSLQTLISNYPTSPLLDEAHFQLAETSYELSQIANRDQKARTQASDHLTEFLKQYGNSSLAERAEILKNQLDEQDAEKNYRIGLYYEKQGFIESALIYYEDVANRYANTPFGKKAAERYHAVSEPAQVMAKGKETVDRRLAEVQTMIQAIDKESEKKEAKGTPADTDLKKQLESELTTLKLAQKEFKEDSKQKFKDRKKALRDREKNLTQKFKTFKKRKKSMRQNAAPELAQVFERWEQSLVNEQEELKKERQTIGSLGVGMKATKEKEESSSSWLPYFGGIGAPNGEKITRFDEKKWNKLERKRLELKQARESAQVELNNLVQEISGLETQEFEQAKSTPEFNTLLPDSLKKEGARVNAMQIEFNELKQNFEKSKQNYRSQFGSAFLATLIEKPSASAVVSGNPGTELEKLQDQKATLSENWLAAKERLETLVKALGRDSSGHVLEPEAGSVPDEGDQNREARMLKKRIKFLEREIRGRIDQILDWEKENAKRTDKLNELLHPEDEHTIGDTTQKLLTPATGSYKLFKAFLFGLPDRNQDLIKEAEKKVTEGQLPPERLKAIREIEEEIALQNALISGRAKEVTEMQQQLATLREQAEKYPDFEYQSMLIDRFPFALSHSVESAAHELTGGKNQEALLVDLVNRQTLEINRLEGEIKVLDQKIGQLAPLAAKQAASSANPVSTAAAGILASIPGTTETLPTPQPERPSDDVKKKLETELTNLNDQLSQSEIQYQETSLAFQSHTLDWYRTEGRKQLNLPKTSESELLSDQLSHLQKRQSEVSSSLNSTVEKEYQVIQTQIKFLDKKLEELGKRSRGLKGPDRSLEDVLDREVKETGALRDSLLQDVSLLENLMKK